MKAKTHQRPIIPLLLCIALCVGLALLLPGRASAAEYAGAAPSSGVAVEIAPPAGRAFKSAEVGFTITDTAGSGFASAKVKLGLDGEWRDVTDALEQWENRYTGRVTITDNCAVTVKVTGHNGKICEKMRYINCFEDGTQPFLPGGARDYSRTVRAAFNTPADTAAGGNGSTAAVIQSFSAAPDSQTDTTPRNPTALTPDGQGTVMDDVTDGDGKEFFTITTPGENTFYLVIDRQRESENVYFLNAVTESDLLALAEKGKEPEGNNVPAIPAPEPVCTCTDKCAPGAVNTDCPVCAVSMKDCAGKAPAAGTDAVPEPQKPERGNSSTMILAVLAALIAGGAGCYLKIYKPRHDLDSAEDFDDLTGGDEETVNEDDLPLTPRHISRDEPEEPDYPEGYGYEEPEDGE